MIIDALQYCNWSEKIFKDMQKANINAVHTTIAYHGNFRETIHQITKWNARFQKYQNLIQHAKSIEDIKNAQKNGKTAIIFGLQNCSPIEDDIALITILYDLGIRFMQLSYNNQSLLASGYEEKNDAGITKMGLHAIKEMNRVGMIIDMSHSGEISTLQAMDISTKPIAITHANPSSWCPTLRNKSDNVLYALAKSGGIIGCSLYPNHLKNKSECTKNEFCIMIAKLADKIGVEHIGIGSDLCQNQPDNVVEWMRKGRWFSENVEKTKKETGFPKPLKWFKSNRDFPKIAKGLEKVGFSKSEIKKIMGENWWNFFKNACKK